MGERLSFSERRERLRRGMETRQQKVQLLRGEQLHRNPELLEHRVGGNTEPNTEL